MKEFVVTNEVNYPAIIPDYHSIGTPLLIPQVVIPLLVAPQYNAMYLTIPPLTILVPPALAQSRKNKKFGNIFKTKTSLHPSHVYFVVMDFIFWS